MDDAERDPRFDTDLRLRAAQLSQEHSVREVARLIDRSVSRTHELIHEGRELAAKEAHQHG